MDCPFIKGKPENDTEEDKEICRNCPYPECVHDHEKGRGSKISNSAIKALRNAKIKEQSKTKTTKELAEEFNLSVRTIQGITLKNAKKLA